MARQRVNAEICPGCESTSIIDHPEQPGVYACSACGRALVRVRRNSIFGEQFTYVDPNTQRAGMRVYTNDSEGKPRGSSRRQEES